MKGISVIICTYNGAERLPATLKNLALQKAGELVWELIIVDNGSTDNTKIIAKECWDAYGKPVPLTIRYQPQLGKSFALMLGFKDAVYDYLLICDDDNWLSPGYLSLAMEIMEANPDFGILGGRAEAVADESIPGWFYELQYAYACGTPHSVSADFTGTGMLWGAGMVLRKKVASIIMSPDMPTILTGRKGISLTAGEDDEKCVRTWLLGYKTYYDYRLFLQHYMPKSRLNKEYCARLLAGFQQQGSIIAAYRRLYYFKYHSKTTYNWPFQLLAWLASFIKGDKTQRRIAGDYLYFGLGSPLWRSAENEIVMRYWKFVQKSGLVRQ